jgi:hypothetical protein
MWLLGALFACDQADPPLAAAEAIVAVHRAEPIDPCDPESWAYDALRALNDAILSDRSATLQAILARHPAMEPLASEALFRRWMQEQRAAIDNDRHLTSFLAGNSGWHRHGAKLSFLEKGGLWFEEPGQLARSGSWKVASGAILLSLARETTAHLLTGPYALAIDAGDLGVWSPDPPYDGCE